MTSTTALTAKRLDILIYWIYLGNFLVYTLITLLVQLLVFHSIK